MVGPTRSPCRIFRRAEPHPLAEMVVVPVRSEMLRGPDGSAVLYVRGSRGEGSWRLAAAGPRGGGWVGAARRVGEGVLGAAGLVRAGLGPQPASAGPVPCLDQPVELCVRD